MNLPPLLAESRVGPLRSALRAADGDTLREQLELVRIPAPTFREETRAAFVAGRLREVGLADVRRDEVGNVLGLLPGGAKDDPPVVIAAHLDTVFPSEEVIEVRNRGGRIYAPGITDNARGLAAMLAIARTLAAAGATRAPILFAASVGEEGAGDLRGVKHLFRSGGEGEGAAAFIALDGCGIRRIVHRAIGSRRLRVSVAGPGGHSWADRGSPNPITAVAHAAHRMSTDPAPGAETASITVARVGGGTSINSIPDGAWMEIDMRSEIAEALAAREQHARAVIRAAVESENASRRAGTPPLRVTVEVIGDRPSGETPAGSAVVRAAMAATQAIGERAELVASSTDANVPISLGIPAIAIGAGGDGGGIHTIDEWYSNTKGALGLERALLTLLAVAELRG